MKVTFNGKWRGKIIGRNAQSSQRVVVSGASSGNGAYNGVVGNSFVFEDGDAELLKWTPKFGQ